MKIKGSISLLINRDETTIELRDVDASVTFAKVTLTPEQLSTALSRLMYVPCIINISQIDKIGKIHENRSFVFEIPKDLRDDEKLQKIAQGLLTDGWVAENYFGSQNSFFQRDGKYFATVTIRRWN